MEPGSLLIGWWNTVPTVEYLQLVEQAGREVTVMNRFLIDLPDLEQLIERRLGSQAIYLDEPPGETLSDYQGIREGPLYRLVRRPGVGSRDPSETL